LSSGSKECGGGCCSYYSRGAGDGGECEFAHGCR
jgi:hypothetical protein